MRNKKVVQAIILTIIFLGVSVFFMMCHEQWSEEAASWQIAKLINFDNFIEYININLYPPLWTLLLIPFAKCGLPLITVNILSVIIVSVAVFLFAWKAKTNLLTKILLIASAICLYWMSVVAQSYSLGILGIVLVGLSYKDRFAHPFKYLASIALLAQGHITYLCLCLALVVTFVVELVKKHNECKTDKRAVLIGFALAVTSIASMIISLISFISTRGVLSIIESGRITVDFAAIMEAINNLIFGIGLPIIQFMLIVVAIYLFGKNKKIFCCWLLAQVWYFAYLIIIRNSNLTREQIAIVEICINAVCVWIANREAKYCKNRISEICRKSALYSLIVSVVPSYTLCLLPVFGSIPATLNLAFKDVEMTFSNSSDIAKWINDTDEDAVFVVSGRSDELTTTAVLAKLNGKKFYSAYDKAEFEYQKYNEDYSNQHIEDEEFLEMVSELNKDHKVYYYRTLASCGSNSTNYEPKDWTIAHTWERSNKGYGMEPAVRVYEVPDDYQYKEE